MATKQKPKSRPGMKIKAVKKSPGSEYDGQRPSAVDLEPLISLSDAAKILNTSVDTVSRAIQQGKLAAWRVGGVKTRRSAVERFLESVKKN